MPGATRSVARRSGPGRPGPVSSQWRSVRPTTQPASASAPSAHGQRRRGGDGGAVQPEK